MRNYCCILDLFPNLCEAVELVGCDVGGHVSHKLHEQLSHHCADQEQKRPYPDRRNQRAMQTPACALSPESTEQIVKNAAWRVPQLGQRGRKLWRASASRPCQPYDTGDGNDMDQE